MMLLTRRHHHPNYWQDGDEKSRRRENGIRMTIDRFTAWAMCPACRSVDCHWIRKPNPNTANLPTDNITVESFDGRIMVRSFTLGGWDETPFEVIRTCKACSHEWGMN